MRSFLMSVLAVAACGKSTTDPHTIAEKTEAKPAPAIPAVRAPARGPEHTIYSLVDNRLAGHLTRGGGLLVPAGSAGFAKYVRFGNVMKGASKKAWDLRQVEGDIKVARLAGKTGSIFVPLTAAELKNPTLRMRMFTKSAGTLTLKVNEGKDLNTKTTAGWSTIEITVPAGQLKEGENSLSLYTKTPGAELAWLQIGQTTPVGDDGATKFYDAAQKALILPKDGQMSWFVAVPEKAKLAGDLADGACAVTVVATADDGASATGKLTGINTAVDLGALAGKAVRLDLEATGCNEAALTGAALVAPGAAPTVKHGDAPKYVVFVVMDSLRADRIRQFNKKARPETPTWDKLAESSALFESDYVQGNESQVSHAAIWSSNYLAKHKAIEMGDKLADKWVTIDEVAKKGGMFVAGASGNGYIRPSRGFGSGWDKFVNHIEKDLGLKGADIMEKGLSFVAPKKDAPWFLYLGFIDTHVTWRAKQPWMDRYDGGYKGRFATEYGDDGPNGSDGKNLSEKEHEHVRALYDSNVSYQDAQIAALIEKLTAWGVWDKTMLIITADHGDEQWEDGRVGHGGSERETLLHVPLLIHYPPLFPAGKVTEGTESIDIVPTLAEALGVAADAEWQGMSLVPLANGIGGYPLMSFSSQYENGHGGRIGHWKLRLSGPNAPKLYDLAKDPDERKDLFSTNEIGARLLLDPMWTLRQWNVEWKKAQWGNASNVSSRFAADLGE